ncbi:MAG TPA: hypothetical protein DEQ74_02770, partial [Wolbachia sp.]|nr:hypothetical protein [Wolbachia sp.]
AGFVNLRHGAFGLGFLTILSATLFMLFRRGSTEADPEHHIRKPLNTIQRTIKTTLAKRLGLNIGRNDVIQTVGWPGSSRKDYGYRINPFTVVIKVIC